jgi:hypothetical protein
LHTIADNRSRHLGHSTSNLGLEVRPPMRATARVVPSVVATELEGLLRDYLSDRKAQGMSMKTIKLYRDAIEGVLLPIARSRKPLSSTLGHTFCRLTSPERASLP